MVLLTKKRSDLHSKRQVFAVLFYFDELLLINFPFYRLCFFKSSLKTLPSPRFWIFWSMCFLKKICNFASYICLKSILSFVLFVYKMWDVSWVASITPGDIQLIFLSYFFSELSFLHWIASALSKLRWICVQGLFLCSPLCSIHLFVYLFTNITLSCKKYLHHLFLWAILPSLNLIIPYFPPWHFQSHLSFV